MVLISFSMLIHRDCYYGVYEGGSKGFTMFCGQLVARNLGNMVS